MTMMKPGSLWPRAVPGFACAAVLVLVGCQTYSPNPIDADAHRAQFFARTPEAPEVQDLLDRLAPGHRPEVFDPSDGFSLEEAEVVALVFNADLRRARAAAGVTAANVEYAGLWEDPVLGTDLARIIQSTPHPWRVFTTVGLTIPLSGRLDAEVRRARADNAAELVRVYEVEWLVRSELREEWVLWSSATERASLLSALTDQMEQLVSTIDAMERAGELAPVEAGLFRMEQIVRLIQREEARNSIREHEQNVLRLMGLAPAAEVMLVPSGGIGDLVASLDELIDAALIRSPSLALARARYEVAERTLQREVRAQYPDLRIGPGYGREDGQDQALLSLSVPVPLLNRNQRGIAAARAQRDLAHVEFLALSESIVAGLAVESARLTGARTKVAGIRDQLLPLLERQYAQARSLAELGEVNTFLLLETLTRQYEAGLSLIDARQDERTARIRLERLVGPPERSVYTEPTAEDIQ